MENQVPDEIVKERFDRLLKEIQTISTEITDARLGETVDVLFEEVNTQDATLITGRLSNNAVVHCPGDATFIGQIKQVILQESRGFYYMGKVLE